MKKENIVKIISYSIISIVGIILIIESYHIGIWLEIMGLVLFIAPIADVLNNTEHKNQRC